MSSNSGPMPATLPQESASREDEFAAFERLPPEVRDAIDYATFPLLALSIERAIAKTGLSPDEAADAIRGLDEINAAEFRREIGKWW